MQCRASTFLAFSIQRSFSVTEPDSSTRSIQALDTLTWTKGKHTLKFGGDFRHLNGLYQNSYAQSRLGIYSFDGSVMSSILTGGVTTAYEPMESFLLGYPDSTQISTILQPNNEFYRLPTPSSPRMTGRSRRA